MKKLALICVLFLLTAADLCHAQDGTTKWTYQASGMVLSSPGIGSDGTIYFASGRQTLNGLPVAPTGQLYAVRTDGTLKWTYKVNATIYASPSIGSDGTIYIEANDGKLHALRADGVLRWKYDLNKYLRYGDGFSAAAIGADGTVYVKSGKGHLTAISASGIYKWSFPTYGDNLSQAAIGVDGTIYVIDSFDGIPYELYAVTPDGYFKWSYPLGGGYFSRANPPVIGNDGTIYVGDSDGAVHAVNLNGTMKWKRKLGYLPSSPVIGSDGTIYLGVQVNDSSTGYLASHRLYAIALDGTIKWLCKLAGLLENTPAVAADGTIFVGSRGGTLYAVKPDGTLKWSRYIAYEILSSSPAIGTDGTIYLGGSDKLYAIKTTSGGLATSNWPMIHQNPRHTAQAVWFRVYFRLFPYYFPLNLN